MLKGKASAFLTLLATGIERLTSLKMINTGLCSGMSVQEMMEQLPEEWEAWRKDPFRYRFAGGESYKDVVQNVESFVLDLERQVRRSAKATPPHTHAHSGTSCCLGAGAP